MTEAIVISVLGVVQIVLITIIKNSFKRTDDTAKSIFKISQKIEKNGAILNENKKAIDKLKNNVSSLTVQTAQVVAKLYDAKILTDSDFIKNYLERKINETK